jgi:hypothetical protein
MNFKLNLLFSTLASLLQVSARLDVNKSTKNNRGNTPERRVQISSVMRAITIKSQRIFVVQGKRKLSSLRATPGRTHYEYFN